MQAVGFNCTNIDWLNVWNLSLGFAFTNSIQFVYRAFYPNFMITSVPFCLPRGKLNRTSKLYKYERLNSFELDEPHLQPRINFWSNLKSKKESFANGVGDLYPINRIFQSLEKHEMKRKLNPFGKSCWLRQHMNKHQRHTASEYNALFVLSG